MISQVRTSALDERDISSFVRDKLTEAQTQVSFALAQKGDVTEDGSGALSVSYQGNDANASSNSFALSLQVTGEIDPTFIGDQRGMLQVNPQTAAESYLWSGFSWAAAGTLIGGEVEANFCDVLYASIGNDALPCGTNASYEKRSCLRSPLPVKTLKRCSDKPMRSIYSGVRADGSFTTRSRA